MYTFVHDCTQLYKRNEHMRVRKETYQQIKFLAEKSGLSMTQLVAEVFEAIFQIGCTYSSLNLNYSFVISESKLTITVEGKNNLISGEMRASTADKEAKISPITVLVKPKGGK